MSFVSEGGRSSISIQAVFEILQFISVVVMIKTGKANNTKWIKEAEKKNHVSAPPKNWLGAKTGE